MLRHAFASNPSGKFLHELASFCGMRLQATTIIQNGANIMLDLEVAAVIMMDQEITNQTNIICCKTVNEMQNTPVV